MPAAGEPFVIALTHRALRPNAGGISGRQGNDAPRAPYSSGTLIGQDTPVQAHDGARPLSVGVDVRNLDHERLRGVARYTLELVRALSERPAVRLLAFTDRHLEVDLPVEAISFAASREIVGEQVRLPGLLAKRRLDVFWCPANRGLPLATPCPTVLTLHDVVEWDGRFVEVPSGKSAFRFAYANVASLAGAALVLTVSRHSATTISERLGIDQTRIRVVPEAPSEQFFQRPDPAVIDAARVRYGVVEGSILYVGGFDAKKDVATLVRAFSRLPAHIAPRLVLCGAQGDGWAETLALINALGLEQRVTQPGFIADADLPALYRSAACFVFPAIAEGFGLPVVEAMASGLPVVAAAAGSLPEVVGTGGVLFPPGDDVAAAKEIEAILQSPEHSSCLGAKARERAATFSWGESARQTEAVLFEAAGTPIRRRLSQSARALRSAHRWVSVR